MAREQLSHLESCARVLRGARLKIQIVIEGNQVNIAEELLAFGQHRRRVTPGADLPVLAQLRHRSGKCGDSLFVVFEQKKRFHTAA